MQQQHPRASLNSLATIHSGFPFRGRVEEDEAGDIRVLQIRDLRQGTKLKAEDLTLIKSPPEHLIKPLEIGDVVLPARGEKNQAVLFNLEAHTITNSHLLTLRVTSGETLPAYLCWALNQPAAQYAMRSQAMGTNMPLLTRRSLEELKIPVPPLAAQQKIIHLQQLWEQEQQLTQQLLNNRETMLKGMFHQLMNPAGAAPSLTTPPRGDK